MLDHLTRIVWMHDFPPQQKLVRISAALKVLTVQMFTDMIRGGDLDENSDENIDSSQKESS